MASLWFVVVLPVVLLATVFPSLTHADLAARDSYRETDPAALGWTERIVEKQGDIYLAGIFPLWNKDGKTELCQRNSSFRDDLALWLALPFIDVLRQSNFTLSAKLRDGRGGMVTLRIGYLLTDQCHDEASLPGLAQFALHTTGIAQERLCQRGVNALDGPKRRLVGVVGPTRSLLAELTAPIFAARQIVQLAPFVTLKTPNVFCDDSDSDCQSTEPTDYDHLYPMSTENTHEATAIADLLLHMNWTHFGIIASSNDTSSPAVLDDLLSVLNLPRYSFLCKAFFTSQCRQPLKARRMLTHSFVLIQWRR